MTQKFLWVIRKSRKRKKILIFLKKKKRGIGISKKENATQLGPPTSMGAHPLLTKRQHITKREPQWRCISLMALILPMQLRTYPYSRPTLTACTMPSAPLIPLFLINSLNVVHYGNSATQSPGMNLVKQSKNSKFSKHLDESFKAMSMSPVNLCHVYKHVKRLLLW